MFKNRVSITHSNFDTGKKPTNENTRMFGQTKTLSRPKNKNNNRNSDSSPSKEFTLQKSTKKEETKRGDVFCFDTTMHQPTSLMFRRPTRKRTAPTGNIISSVRIYTAQRIT